MCVCVCVPSPLTLFPLLPPLMSIPLLPCCPCYTAAVCPLLPFVRMATSFTILTVSCVVSIRSCLEDVRRVLEEDLPRHSEHPVSRPTCRGCTGPVPTYALHSCSFLVSTWLSLPSGLSPSVMLSRRRLHVTPGLCLACLERCGSRVEDSDSPRTRLRLRVWAGTLSTTCLPTSTKSATSLAWCTTMPTTSRSPVLLQRHPSEPYRPPLFISVFAPLSSPPVVPTPQRVGARSGRSRCNQTRLL
jgi:hypothetical protein